MRDQLEDCASRVYRFALRMTRDHHQAEDLTQETLLRAWSQRHRIARPGALRTYLFTVAANLWRDQLRRRHPPGKAAPLERFVEPVSLGVSTESSFIRREDVALAMRWLGELPDRQREVLHLSAVEELWQGRPGDLRLDGQRNSMLLRGSNKTAASFLDLMAQIDQPIDVPAQREFRSGRVRIVWLLRDPSLGESLRPPPDDLKPVIEELEKEGITDLLEACQLQVTALVDQPFELTSSPSLGQRGCELQVQGKFLPKKGDLLPLQFTVEANEVSEKTEARPGGIAVQVSRKRLCNFQTTIEAPLSHPVVLCVNPIGDATSVFVVKLLP